MPDLAPYPETARHVVLQTLHGVRHQSTAQGLGPDRGNEALEAFRRLTAWHEQRAGYLFWLLARYVAQADFERYLMRRGRAPRELATDMLSVEAEVRSEVGDSADNLRGYAGVPPDRPVGEPGEEGEVLVRLTGAEREWVASFLEYQHGEAYIRGDDAKLAKSIITKLEVTDGS